MSSRKRCGTASSTARDLCAEHEVVLIFDEVITGFRLDLAGAQGFFGVTPDLATFGKAMANGFPVACLAVDKGRNREFVGAMLNRGIRLLSRGLWYLPAARTETDIQRALDTAEDIWIAD